MVLYNSRHTPHCRYVRINTIECQMLIRQKEYRLNIHDKYSKTLFIFMSLKSLKGIKNKPKSSK